MNRTGIFLCAAASLIAACAVGPDYEPPEFSLPDAYQTTLSGSAAQESLWWLGFEDAVLNELIDKALADNFDIGISVARLNEAEALLRVDQSALFPDLSLTADAEREFSDSGTTDDRTTGGIAMSYMPDLFGGVRRRIENAVALADAERFSVEDAGRLTASAVALVYIELRRADARLELLEQSLQLQNQTLEIVQARRLAGLSPDLDVRRAAADLARTRAQRGGLEISRARSRNALTVLTGDSSARSRSDDMRQPDAVVPTFASGPQVAAPGDLLRRRPDLRAAEANLMAATAAIGIEEADLYPALQLPARITTGIGSTDLGDDLVGTISAALTAPLFNAGRRRAEVDAARYRADAALLVYEQVLLTALADTETALITINNREDQLAALTTAVEESEKAYEQLNSLYREGLATFIDILDAQRTLISSRESFVDAEADLAASYVDLYRAIGAPTNTLRTAVK